MNDDLAKNEGRLSGGDNQVMGILKPNLLNFLKNFLLSQAWGYKKLGTQANDPPGETFTIYYSLHL